MSSLDPQSKTYCQSVAPKHIHRSYLYRYHRLRATMWKMCQYFDPEKEPPMPSSSRKNGHGDKMEG